MSTCAGEEAAAARCAVGPAEERHLRAQCVGAAEWRPGPRRWRRRETPRRSARANLHKGMWLEHEPLMSEAACWCLGGWSALLSAVCRPVISAGSSLEFSRGESYRLFHAAMLQEQQAKRISELTARVEGLEKRLQDASKVCSVLSFCSSRLEFDGNGSFLIGHSLASDVCPSLCLPKVSTVC